MKKILCILFLSFSILSFGQKSLMNFKGNLIFKEENFFVALTRELNDTTISYYSFEIDSAIEIEEYGFFRNSDLSFKYFKFQFIKKHDSLFISYLNPLSKKYETDYMYPLNKRDTVDAPCGYKLHIDSDYVKKENGIESYRKNISFCNDDNNYDATYKKDTIIKFKEYVFDCYYIELEHPFNRNLTKYRRRVFIDKTSLIPVYEDEFCFTMRSRRIPKNKWVLIKRMSLIGVDGD